MNKNTGLSSVECKRPWLSPWGTAMSRDVTLSFRTDQKLCRSLETIALEDSRPISSTIEQILKQYVEGKEESAKKAEKRRCERKEVNIPAMFRSAHTQYPRLTGGLILDLSLGGLCVSLPDESAASNGESEKETRFAATFVVPEIGRTVTMFCERRWSMPLRGKVHVGASFVDGDFSEYQSLQRFLMQ
jgi:hypothetical protein